jgi:hypothetical protein
MIVMDGRTSGKSLAKSESQQWELAFCPIFFDHVKCQVLRFTLKLAKFGTKIAATPFWLCCTF